MIKMPYKKGKKGNKKKNIQPTKDKTFFDLIKMEKDEFEEMLSDTCHNKQTMDAERKRWLAIPKIFYILTSVEENREMLCGIPAVQNALKEITMFSELNGEVLNKRMDKLKGGIGQRASTVLKPYQIDHVSRLLQIYHKSPLRIH